MPTNTIKFLDRRSKIPNHIQLLNTFRREILDGNYAFGELLPSSEELSTRFDISIDKLQEVFDSLLDEKLVFLDSGGYRCKYKAVPTVIFENISDFRFIIESRGMNYSVTDSPIVFDESNNDDIRIRFHRTYFGDNQCLIFAYANFCLNKFPKLKEKSTSDTRPFVMYFNENHVSEYNTSRSIYHEELPDNIALLMNQAKGSTCSRTVFRAMQGDELLLESITFIVRFGFRFHFMTLLDE